MSFGNFCRIVFNTKITKLNFAICFRCSVHSMAYRFYKRTDVTSASSHTNYRFLSTPEKVSRMHSLRKRNKALMAKVTRMKARLESLIKEKGVILDDSTSEDMQVIMEEEDKTITDKYPEDSFQYIFWRQQKECLSSKKRGFDGIL